MVQAEKDFTSLKNLAKTRDGQNVYCPTCQKRSITKTEPVTSLMQYLLCAVLLPTQCCCCLPFCFDSCKDTYHTCGYCGTLLGAKRFIA